MSARRFTSLLPFVLAPLGCTNTTPDTTGPCHGSATLFTCGLGGNAPTPDSPDAAVGASVEVEGDLTTCGFSDAGSYQPQPADVCSALCPSQFQQCAIVGNPPSRHLICVRAGGSFGACTGRRPAGFEVTPVDVTNLDEYFAMLAALESASVDAFELLADDLRRLGASPSLVSRATNAAVDERRHAETMRGFAGDSGETKPSATRSPAPTIARALIDVAVENAVEGCVRETYGAAFGAWQACNAHDARLRCVFTSVAADESEHADLAWDIHDWAMTMLTAAERSEVARAMSSARDALRSECGSCEIFTALDQQLWS